MIIVIIDILMMEVIFNVNPDPNEAGPRAPAAWAKSPVGCIVAPGTPMMIEISNMRPALAPVAPSMSGSRIGRVKISAEAKAKNRQAILDTASRQIRSKGPSGLGVAEVMAGAGLTHGGFYNHFSSREDLAAHALDQAIRQATERLLHAVQQRDLESFLDGYLSEQHLDHVADGCPFAATASDIARQPRAVRAVFASGLRDYLDTGSEDLDRAEAIRRLTAATGALTLARAVAGDDRALALELLAAVRER